MISSLRGAVKTKASGTRFTRCLNGVAQRSNLPAMQSETLVIHEAVVSLK